MDPKLFAEWAQIDEHLRRAINARATVPSISGGDSTTHPAAAENGRHGRRDAARAAYGVLGRKP
jgi:hypothetical protein